MDHKRYQEIVSQFAGRRVIVLGDLMMDEYLWGRATRISPESPVMVVEIDRETSVPGGAANVVNNLLVLGAEVAVIGVVGDDAAGRSLKAILGDQGADVSGVIDDSTRPTTRKTRVVAHSQQVLRVDREQARPISEHVSRRMMARLEEELPGAHAVIVSDYNKGVLTQYNAAAIVGAARKSGAILTANPKPSNARALAGASVVQLNQSEAEMTAVICGAGMGVIRVSFNSESEMHTSGAALVEALEIDALVVTRGAKGLGVWQRGGSYTAVPPHAVEVYDSAGAGDTVISTMTLGMAAGAPAEEAAVVANHAASCVVRKVGVATVTADELIADYKEC